MRKTFAIRVIPGEDGVYAEVVRKRRGSTDIKLTPPVRVESLRLESVVNAMGIRRKDGRNETPRG